MPRLVTFGCSYVYGHGLHDCYREDKTPESEPSKFAWPNILAKKLGYECVNLSNPGIGNLEMFMKILKTKFLPDDLVIVAWSFFVRFDHYQILNNNGEGKRVPFSKSMSENNKEKILSYEYYLEKNYWDNWLTIQHCELFLNDKNIRNISYLGFTKNKENLAHTVIPKLVKLKNLLAIDLVKIDYGLDNSHPGIKSHQLQAEKIYSKLIEHELR